MYVPRSCTIVNDFLCHRFSFPLSLAPRPSQRFSRALRGSLPLVSEEPRAPTCSLPPPPLPATFHFLLPPRRAPFFTLAHPRPRSAPRLNELIDGVALFVEANGHGTGRSGACKHLLRNRRCCFVWSAIIRLFNWSVRRSTRVALSEVGEEGCRYTDVCPAIPCATSR